MEKPELELKTSYTKSKENLWTKDMELPEWLKEDKTESNTPDWLQGSFDNDEKKDNKQNINWAKESFTPIEAKKEKKENLWTDDMKIPDWLFSDDEEMTKRQKKKEERKQESYFRKLMRANKKFWPEIE